MTRRGGLALLFAAWAGVAGADVYGFRGAEGVVFFTDAPTEHGFELLIREGTPPPPLHWSEFARREAERQGIDPRLVRALIHAESRANPAAVSPKGAQGLMQLMPATARELGVADPFHPNDNVRGGIRYLAQLIQRYPGRLDWALAAYNAGPGAVDRYRGIPPFPETRRYVTTVLDNYQRLRREEG